MGRILVLYSLDLIVVQADTESGKGTGEPDRAPVPLRLWRNSCQKPVVGCQKAVVGCQLSEASCQLLVVGCQKPVAGCQLSEPNISKVFKTGAL
jgi:hypothetical protein